jgi:hypothetical protein
MGFSFLMVLGLGQNRLNAEMREMRSDWANRGDLNDVAQIVVAKNQIATEFIRDLKKKSNSFRRWLFRGSKLRAIHDDAPAANFAFADDLAFLLHRRRAANRAENR